MGIKVELPSNEVHRLLDEWRNRAMQLEGELTELQAAIGSVEARLNGKLPAPLTTTDKLASRGTNRHSGAGRQKKRKGENLRVLQSYLGELGNKGATIADLSENTGIGVSSVYAVLMKHPTVFSKGHDKLWRIK